MVLKMSAIFDLDHEVLSNRGSKRPRSNLDSEPLSNRGSKQPRPNLDQSDHTREFELSRVRREVAPTETLPDEISLPRCSFEVGSTAEGANALCLEHPSLSRFVSRSHAEFGPSGDGHYVADRGSTNGTWVNGERLKPHHRRALVTGDKLTFGEPTVVVQLAQTLNCYAYVYQERTMGAQKEKLIVPYAAPSRGESVYPESFERSGQHDFGRPISPFIARKLRDKGIYKMHSDTMRPKNF
jgi:hypothetical protein